MHAIGFAFAWLLLLLAIVVALVNWFCFVKNYLNRRHGIAKNYSVVPALGFILLVIAGFVSPRGPGAWIVVPVMLDPGTWILIALPLVMLREWFSRK
jgi:hypothetical protein